MRNLLILVFTCFSFYLFSQDAPVNGWELREEIDKKEVKENRDKFLKNLQQEHAKHYNVAQGRWYIGLRGGYGIPFLTVNRRNIETYLGVSDYFESESGEISDKTVVTTDAKGFRSGVYFGFRINPYVAVELDVAFNTYQNTLQGRVESPDLNSELVTRGRDFNFSPQLVLMSPEVGNFTFFGKFGMSFPVFGYAKGNAFVEDYNGTFIKNIATKSDGQLLELLDAVATMLGESVGGLGFLDEGIFKAAGYKFTLDAEPYIGIRVNEHAIGYTTSLGFVYQINPLISILGEARVGGYNVTTKFYDLNQVNGSLDLLGIRDYAVFNNDGVVINGDQVIPREELRWLYEVNYHYKLDENSNNEKTNPDGIDPTKPSDRLGLRRSTFAASLNVSVQFNLKGKRDNK